MNIVGCLDQATSGRLILDGQDISKCSDNQMSDIRLQKIGFVFPELPTPCKTERNGKCMPAVDVRGRAEKKREESGQRLPSSGWGSATV